MSSPSLHQTLSKNSTTVRLPFPPGILTESLKWAPFLRRPVLTRLFLSPIVRSKSPGEAMGVVIGTVQVGRTDVRVRARGRGPVVLLVHGWQGSGRHVFELGERLVAEGYTAVSFDMPAHGETAGHMTSLPEFAETIARVAAFVGPVHGVVAHSLGATATALALQWGDRWPLDPKAVALIAPMVSFDFALDEFAKILKLNPELREATAVGTEQRVGITRAEVDLLAFDEPEPQVLLVHDRDDSRVPLSNTERLAERWSSAQLVRTFGLGHRRLLDDPIVADAVTEALNAAPREGEPLGFGCAPELVS